MKWTKFPSQHELMGRIFSKYCEIVVSQEIKYGLKPAAFLAIYKAKEIRRRKHINGASLLLAFCYGLQKGIGQSG